VEIQTYPGRAVTRRFDRVALLSFVQLYLLATIASILTVTAIAAMVLVLSSKLLRGGPFSRTVTWLVGGAAVILITGGLISQILHAISRPSMIDALRYLATLNHLKIGNPPSTLDFGPIAAGVVLAVIAAAFKIGERLQRDTEGLV
jgi:choline-glycine betaine transporter